MSVLTISSFPHHTAHTLCVFVCCLCLFVARSFVSLGRAREDLRVMQPVLLWMAGLGAMLRPGHGTGVCSLAHFNLRGGGASATVSVEDEEARLKHEYERYKECVEMPLTNVDEHIAQRTQCVRVRGLLSKEDIAAVHRAGKALAAQNSGATIDRSAWGQPNGTWLVTFLNTEGAFESMLPEIYERIRRAAIAADRDHWNLTSGIEHVNYRVVEYHTMRSTLDGKPTKGGLRTQRHVDQGSLITIDILLSDLAEIDGGVLQTLEADGTLLSHEWEQGDALIFLSHKYHCVSELRAGTRHVLVSELWQGTENTAPSRDEKERWLGTWKEGWRPVE